MLGNVRSYGLVVFLTMCCAVSADACQNEYQTQGGDTLFEVAQDQMGDAFYWPQILEANPKLTGSNLARIAPGIALSIPCREAPIALAMPAPIVEERAVLSVVTSANYAPFASSAGSNQGLLLDIVNAALNMTFEPNDFTLTWDEDWPSHFDRLGAARDFDMSFPWPRPNCSADPDLAICQDFLFSQSLIELPIGVFVKRGAKFQFSDINEITGKTFCQPKGHSTHVLDAPERRWTTDGVITLVAGDDLEDCFVRVLDGHVDAVAVNQITGARLILDMGLRLQIVPLDRTLSSEDLRVLIPKDHPKAAPYLDQFNAGLKLLKDSGAYDEIVARHADAFTQRLVANN